MSWLNAATEKVNKPKDEQYADLEERIKKAAEDNKDVARRLTKASFEQVVRTEDTATVVDLVLNKLLESQIKEAAMEIKRRQIIATMEEALRVAKGDPPP